jgi:hypothetical protein
VGDTKQDAVAVLRRGVTNALKHMDVTFGDLKKISPLYAILSRALVDADQATAPDEVQPAPAAEPSLEARKAAAFDWLENNPESGEPFIVYHPPSDIITWRVKSDQAGEEYDTLLEAVEAAMRAESEGR